MNIKGKSRADGEQLADYLLENRKAENEQIEILQVRSGITKDAKTALTDMDLACSLTKRGKKGIYQAIISPAIGEDQKMTEADWLLCADILEKDLNLEGQNRVLVKHWKRGEDGRIREHMHVAWQREKDGKLIKMNHNYKKHDRSRERMEIALQQARTCQPDQIKEQLSMLWHNSVDGQDFVNKAFEKGYQVGRGDRRAYSVTTPDGKKHDLVRQLKKIKTHEVKDRLDSIAATLPDDKNIEGRPPLTEKQNKRRERLKSKISEASPRFAGEKEKISRIHVQRPQDARRAANDNFQDIVTPNQEQATRRAAVQAQANFNDVAAPTPPIYETNQTPSIETTKPSGKLKEFKSQFTPDKSAQTFKGNLAGLSQDADAEKTRLDQARKGLGDEGRELERD